MTTNNPDRHEAQRAAWNATERARKRFLDALANLQRIDRHAFEHHVEAMRWRMAQHQWQAERQAELAAQDITDNARETLDRLEGYAAPYAELDAVLDRLEGADPQAQKGARP